MKFRVYDRKYSYIYYFDSTTGAYLRTGILDENGFDTGMNPFQGEFPHLIDIGVMGHCEHGRSGLCLNAGIECYQDGFHVHKPNITAKDFEWIIAQCEGKTNQVALGGRGDPDQHEHFEELLRTCQKYNIVPNYTTSGLGMTDAIANISKRYCGAVAVSWYRSDYTLKAIDILQKHGVKTSIHYVLGSHTIDEAIQRLTNDTFPKGIYAIVFLLHKPKGLGSHRNVISPNDDRLKILLELIDQTPFRFQVGFDSCTVPGILSHSKNVRLESIEACEGARFSCYISSDLIMTPCSFDVDFSFGESLRGKTIIKVWNGLSFEAFRNSQRNRCSQCKLQPECMGGCPLMSEIVLCEKRERSYL